jgi:hypothetical protein
MVKVSGKVTQIRRNPKQAEFTSAVMNNTADYIKPGKGGWQRGFTAVFQGGRASGKTFELLDLICISARALPRALAGLASRTFKQVQEIVIAQSETVFNQWGFYQYDAKTRPKGNYVVNKRPPAHWWTPYNSPKSWDNTITFAKGYTVFFLSADRKDTQRGVNFDQYFQDETAFSKQDFYTDIVRAGLRANKKKYQDTRPGRSGHNHPLHWLIAHFSSAPRTLSGSWIYNFEELAKKYPEKNYWLEATAYDNLEFLPGDYLESAKEDMPPLAFDIEIMNRRPKKVDAAFYAAFNTQKHCYTAYGYDFDEETGIWKSTPNDYDTFKPLEVSFDFNNAFTSVIVCQDFDKEFRAIKELWVKQSNLDLVTQLTNNLCEHYKHHLKRKIFVHGDYNGKTTSPGNTQTFFQLIFSILRANGWEVHDMVDNNPKMPVRYKVVNVILAEGTERLPKIRINEIECPNLVLSIAYAGTIKDTFEKDKTAERDKTVPQEKATHLSDAFDYIIFKKFSSYVETDSVRTEMISLLSS